MIVLYHNYQLNEEAFIDGANCYYIENTKLLQEQKFSNRKPTPHDFRNVILGKEKLPKLTKRDVLLSNVGPYAHVYHYLREKHNLKFRIIRDVQTTLWPGYLFQEKICNNYMREGDKVIFLSEFTRQLYLKLFPETLNKENTTICAPFMYFFPKKIEKNERKDGNLTLGWIGRVTPEKNFYQALDAFIRLNQERGNVKFIVAGRSANNVKLRIKRELEKKKIKEEDFIYVNNGHFIPHSSVWDLYKKMDVFLFPSLSINESLGRTIVEACYMNIPVVAAHYGASPELLSEKNLISVEYKNKLFQLDSAFPYSFGRVNMDEFIEKLHNYKKLSTQSSIDKYSNHHRKFFNILQGDKLTERPIKLNKQIEEFINRVNLYKDSIRLDIDDVIKRTSRFIAGNTDNRKLVGGKPKFIETKYKTKLTYNKENYYILHNYNFFLSAFLNYNPYASLNESLKVRFQRRIMHLKKPINRPLKIALYLCLKNKYANNLSCFTSQQDNETRSLPLK